MGWSYRYAITYDHTKCGTADSSDFPALVYASAAAMKDAVHGGDVQSSAGADILFFSDSALTTQLASEIESYDNVNGIVWAWVKVGTLSHSADGTIYAGVGNASPPSRTANPWDANFLQVYHMSAVGSANNPSSVASGAVSATKQGDAVGAAAQINGGSTLDGAGDYYQANSVTPPSGAVTISAWAKCSNIRQSGVVCFANDYNSGTTDRALYYDGVAKFSVFNGGVRTAAGTTTLLVNTWYHLTAVIDTSAGSKIYVNGASEGSGNASGTNGYNGYSTPAIVIGAKINGYATNDFQGLLDEVRVSNVTRSASWILSDYNNQVSPGNIGSAGFWTWGAKTTAGTDWALINSGPIKGMTRGGLAR